MNDELSAPPMTSVDASTSGTATVAAGPSELSLLVTTLFKGPMYRDVHDRLWPILLKLRARVTDHVAVMGLRLEVDENEGYAFLRGLRDDETDVEYPRLVNRHTLGFHTSLLIALLRKRLAEFDATSSDTRTISEAKNGSTPLKVSDIGTSLAMEWITKTFIPTGGVINPNSTTTRAMIPNQIFMSSIDMP